MSASGRYVAAVADAVGSSPPEVERRMCLRCGCMLERSRACDRCGCCSECLGERANRCHCDLSERKLDA